MKRPLGRLRRRWKGNIKMKVKNIECEDMDWIHLAVDRVHWRALVNTIMDV
jgi:hypothetical protein